MYAVCCTDVQSGKTPKKQYFFYKKIEEENKFHDIVIWLPHKYIAGICIHTHTIIIIITQRNHLYSNAYCQTLFLVPPYILRY